MNLSINWDLSYDNLASYLKTTLDLVGKVESKITIDDEAKFALFEEIFNKFINYISNPFLSLSNKEDKIKILTLFEESFKDSLCHAASKGCLSIIREQSIGAMACLLVKNNVLDKVLNDMSFFESFIKDGDENYSRKMTYSKLVYRVAMWMPKRSLEIFKDAVRKDNLGIANNLIRFYKDGENFTALDKIIYSLSDLLKENPLLCKVDNIILLKQYCQNKLDQDNGMSDHDRMKFIENLSALVDYDEAIRGVAIIEMIETLQNFITNHRGEGEVLKIHNNYEAKIDKKGADRLLNVNLYMIIYRLDEIVKKNPLFCKNKIMPYAKSYALSRIERDDLSPRGKEKIKGNLEVLDKYSQVIDLLDNQQEDVQDVGCGCAPSLFNRQKPLSRIRQLENFTNICPEESGVFVLDDSYAINLHREGAIQLLERYNRPRSTPSSREDARRAATSATSVATNLTGASFSSRRGGEEARGGRQGCAIM